MEDEREHIVSLFRGFDYPRVMLTIAVPYVEAAIARQTGRSNRWEAAHALIGAIKLGRLFAYGDQNGRESIIPINDFANADSFPGSGYHNWDARDQRVFRWRDGGYGKRSSDLIEEGGKIIWRNINVDTSDVLRLWPWSAKIDSLGTQEVVAESQEEMRRNPLPRSEYPKLRIFLNNLEPCHEDIARLKAEEHFDAYISRDVIRNHRDRKGIAGRKRKSRADVTE